MWTMSTGETPVPLLSPAQLVAPVRLLRTPSPPGRGPGRGVNSAGRVSRRCQQSAKAQGFIPGPQTSFANQTQQPGSESRATPKPRAGPSPARSLVIQLHQQHQHHQRHQRYQHHQHHQRTGETPVPLSSRVPPSGIHVRSHSIPLLSLCLPPRSPRRGASAGVRVSCHARAGAGSRRWAPLAAHRAEARCRRSRP